MKIHRVPSLLINDLWPATEKHVLAALYYHPFLSADDVKRFLLHGSAQLFVAVAEGRVVQGIAIVEVLTYPSRKVAHVLAAGGEEGFLSTAIHELLPILKQWGIEQGADAIAITGRPGWLRALRDEGGNAEKFVSWWARLGGDISVRRKLEVSDSDGHEPAVG